MEVWATEVWAQMLLNRFHKKMMCFAIYAIGGVKIFACLIILQVFAYLLLLPWQHSRVLSFHSPTKYHHILHAASDHCSLWISVVCLSRYRAQQRVNMFLLHHVYVPSPRSLKKHQMITLNNIPCLCLKTTCSIMDDNPSTFQLEFQV